MKQKKVTGSSKYGYTLGKSWLILLLAFSKDSSSLAGEGRTVGDTCPDFSKAFDTISQSILTHKLKKVQTRLVDSETEWQVGEVPDPEACK